MSAFSGLKYKGNLANWQDKKLELAKVLIPSGILSIPFSFLEILFPLKKGRAFILLQILSFRNT